MLALVPLTTLAATGSWRAAWRTCKEYGFVLLLLFVGPMAIGAAIGLVCWVLGIDPT